MNSNNKKKKKTIQQKYRKHTKKKRITGMTREVWELKKGEIVAIKDAT